MLVTKKDTLVEEITLDFENTIKIIYTKENGILKKTSYFCNDKRYNYIPLDKLNEFKITHWSNHSNLLQKIQNSLTEQELINFSNFDCLYYIGCSSDGKMIDWVGNNISTLTYLDEVFSQIYLGIETTKTECEEILNKLDKEFIIKSEIVEIPYYNQNEEKDDHYTIKLEVLISDDLFNEISKKHTLSDYIKKEIYYTILTK